MGQSLLTALRNEKDIKLKGGLYHHTQIKLAYNSNRIVMFKECLNPR
jgi:hypothetical protein